MTRYNTDFNNPALPSGASLASRIAAMPGLRSWWRVGADNTLVSGAISNINPRAGASSVALAQGTADRRPVYTEGAFGTYPGADFDGVNDVLVAGSLPYTKGGTFTWGAILEADAVAAAQYFMALFETVGQSSTLFVNSSGHPTFQHGNGTVTIAQDMRAQKLLLLASSNGTQIKLRVNGVDATPAATNNAQSASFLTIGASNTLGTLLPASCRISDVFVWQSDVLSFPNSIDIVEAYARRAYGVEIA